MAEVYAGFLAHADHHIGRLLDYLEEFGHLENTMVIVVSDNGASGEGGPDGSVNEMLFANGIPDNIQANLAMIDELGGTKTYNHYPNGWAMAFNTPFKMWKRYEFNGGTADPCIISWPSAKDGATAGQGEIRHQYHHAIDIVPTILDTLGVEAPDTIKGHVQSRFDGVSMRYSVDRPVGAVGPQDAVLFDARLARDLARRLEGRHHASRPSAAGATSTTTPGSCTTPTRTAPSCMTWPPSTRRRFGSWSTCGSPRPAKTAPSRLMTGPPIEIIYHAAAADGRGAATATSISPTRPRCPRQQAVNIRNRSYSIGALVDIPAPGAEGVLFAQGSRFGGHALYVKDNRLHYVNNFVGMIEQKIDSTQDVPTGQNLILSASFDKDGEDPPAVSTGILSLYHGDKKVGEGRIKTQPGHVQLAGEGLCVGRDSGEPVTSDYPSGSPHRVHRRHDQAGRRRRERRSVHRPRARGRGHAGPRVGAGAERSRRSPGPGPHRARGSVAHPGRSVPSLCRPRPPYERRNSRRRQATDPVGNIHSRLAGIRAESRTPAR